MSTSGSHSRTIFLCLPATGALLQVSDMPESQQNIWFAMHCVLVHTTKYIGI